MATGDDVTGPMNLGNPGEFSIRELAEIIIEMVGSASKLIYKPLPSDDPKQRQPDIAFARNKLTWEPKIVLRDGLAKTIEYFDHHLTNLT